MAGLGRPEKVIENLGFNDVAFNWEEEPDLKKQIEGLIQEVHDQLRLDPQLAGYYDGGSELQRRVLAAAEEWKAAYLGLLRPAIFKLLGEHAKLAMEDSENFDMLLTRLENRYNELVEDLIGSTPSTARAQGPISHGFKDPYGNLYELPITRLTKW